MDKKCLIGEYFTARSVSGEYFLGEGKCISVRDDGLRCVLEDNKGKKVDVAVICLQRIVFADVAQVEERIFRTDEVGASIASIGSS